MAKKQQEQTVEEAGEVMYIATAKIMRTPQIEAGFPVTIGEGEGDIHPDDVQKYLAAGLIRERKPKGAADGDANSPND